MRVLICLLALSALTACASTGAKTAALEDAAPDCFVREPAANPDGYVWRAVRCADGEAGQVRLDERDAGWADAPGDRPKFSGRDMVRRQEERREFAYGAPPEPAPDLRPAWAAPAYEPAPQMGAIAPKGGPFLNDPFPVQPAPRLIEPKGGPFLNDPMPLGPPRGVQAPAPVAPQAYPDGLAGAAPDYPAPIAPPAAEYGAARGEIYLPSQGRISGESQGYASSSAASSSMSRSTSSATVTRYGAYQGDASYGVQGGLTGSSEQLGYNGSGYGAASALAYGAAKSVEPHPGPEPYQGRYGGSDYASSRYAGSSAYGSTSAGRYEGGGYAGSAYDYAGAGQGAAVSGYGPGSCVSDAGRFANGAASWEATSCQSASARLWTYGSGVYSSGTVATEGGYDGPARNVAGRDPDGFLTWPGKTLP